jgi:hypothetical protein
LNAVLTARHRTRKRAAFIQALVCVLKLPSDASDQEQHKQQQEKKGMDGPHLARVFVASAAGVNVRFPPNADTQGINPAPASAPSLVRVAPLMLGQGKLTETCAKANLTPVWQGWPRRSWRCGTVPTQPRILGPRLQLTRDMKEATFT